MLLCKSFKTPCFEQRRQLINCDVLRATIVLKIKRKAIPTTLLDYTDAVTTGYILGCPVIKRHSRNSWIATPRRQRRQNQPVTATSRRQRRQNQPVTVTSRKQSHQSSADALTRNQAQSDWNTGEAAPKAELSNPLSRNQSPCPCPRSSSRVRPNHSLEHDKIKKPKLNNGLQRPPHRRVSVLSTFSQCGSQSRLKMSANQCHN